MPDEKKHPESPEISEEYLRHAPLHKIVAAELGMDDHEAQEFYRMIGKEE